MVKGKSKNDNHMSDELIKAVKVTPEQTEEFMKKHNVPIIHPRPEGKSPKGKLWCCYCNDWKIFKNKRADDGSYPTCETCKISTNDFHIKTHNKLWLKLGKK